MSVQKVRMTFSSLTSLSEFQQFGEHIKLHANMLESSELFLAERNTCEVLTQFR